MTESNLTFFIQQLWLRRWILLASAAAGFLLALVYLLFAERMYTANLTAIPARHDDSIVQGLDIGSALGGLGALAGLGANHSDQSREAMALLRSRGFIEGFIVDNELLPILFAEDWDSNDSKWKDQTDPPSEWDAYQKFDEDVLAVTENLNLGIIIVGITWNDPEIAASWANKLINRVNSTIRQNTIREAQASLTFLRSELETTGIIEVRQAIFNLTEAQINRIMLANVRPEFAFKIIDPAKAKDKDSYDYPRPFILLPAGVIAGVAFALLASIFRIVLAPVARGSNSRI